MSRPPIKLYAFALSPYVNKTAAMLDYKQLAYQPVFIHPRKKTEIQFSKKKLVPIIDDKGTIVEDSTDIAIYLEETYPTPPMVPADPAARAAVWATEAWLDDVFFLQYFAAHMMGRPNNRRRLLQLMAATAPLTVFERIAMPLVAGVVLRKNIQNAQANLAKETGLLDDLEHRLGTGPFLGGQPQISVADLSAFGALSIIFDLDFEGADELRRRPALTAWFERVRPLTSDGRRLLRASHIVS